MDITITMTSDDWEGLKGALCWSGQYKEGDRDDFAKEEIKKLLLMKYSDYKTYLATTEISENGINITID
jgi:hypothetical protein